MASVISGDANVSATEFGYLDGVTSALQSQIDSKLPLAGGKILQIVRATDSTDRTTTSQTYVDATGMEVTISPQKSDSTLILIFSFAVVITRSGAANTRTQVRIVDASNNAVSGAEGSVIGGSAVVTVQSHVTLVGYSTPATTSPVTYNLEFRSPGAAGNTQTINNSAVTGSMYAIEVSA